MYTMKRIAAVAMRHISALKSPFELFSHFYWIALDIIIFGFIAQSMITDKAAGTTLIMSIVIWYIVVRGSITLANSMWRDLADSTFIGLIATPISLTEWLIGHMILGIVGSAIGFVIGFVCTQFLCDCNVFTLGAPLILIILSLLISSWSVGIIVLSVLITYGKKATTYIYAIPWAVVPFANVYYPISIMPETVQNISRGLPMYYIFQPIHDFIATGVWSYRMLGISLILSAAYLMAAIVLFIFCFKRRKKLGFTTLETEA
jgi:ABC-2 type transport system permease protein